MFHLPSSGGTGSQINQFFCPNQNFDYLRIFSPKQLIQIFTFLLLECKLIFVIDTQAPETTALQIPNLIECLLSLVKPCNTDIFTRLTTIYS
jgi:hypothetical protein